MGFMGNSDNGIRIVKFIPRMFTSIINVKKKNLQQQNFFCHELTLILHGCRCITTWAEHFLQPKKHSTCTAVLISLY